MAIRIEITDEKVKFLTDKAKVVLENGINVVITNVLSEAQRLGGNISTNANEPDINDILIEDCFRAYRYSIKKKKKNGLVNFFKIVAFVSSLFAGNLFDLKVFTDSKINNTAAIIWFLVSFTIALIVTIGLIFKGDQYE